MFSALEPLVMSLRSRVLVVDDEMGVRESLRAILHGECEVVTAASGEAALEVMARDPIDVMTLDLKMPGLGGIGVLERAKQIDPDLEVLIITGYGSLDTAVQGLRLRAFDYLSKPFDSTEVRRLIAKALARRNAVKRMKTVPETLLSSLSHELRTPLNVIMGYSTILQEDGDSLSDEQRLALDRIQSNSNALLSYVETIFYMAELDRRSGDRSAAAAPGLRAPARGSPRAHAQRRPDDRLESDRDHLPPRRTRSRQPRRSRRHGLTGLDPSDSCRTGSPCPSSPPAAP